MRNVFKVFSIIAPIAGLTLSLAPSVSLADLPITLGQQEYMSSCASCHGAEGNGDGPVAEQLAVAPANLRMIKQNHNGVFPTAKVLRIIDGRETVRAHGTAAMPVWGSVYALDATAAGGKETPTPSQLEMAVTGRILSLVYYLESIQAE